MLLCLYSNLWFILPLVWLRWKLFCLFNHAPICDRGRAHTLQTVQDQKSLKLTTATHHLCYHFDYMWHILKKKVSTTKCKLGYNFTYSIIYYLSKLKSRLEWNLNPLNKTIARCKRLDLKHIVAALSVYPVPCTANNLKTTGGF